MTNKYEIIAYRTERLTSTVFAETREEAERLWRLGVSQNDEYSQPTEWEIDEVEDLGNQPSIY